MSDISDAVAARFLAQCRHYLNVEYRAKLRQAVAALPEDVLWSRPNAASNSVGNLLLHLAGNIRQWIVAGVGGAPDRRHRAAEFDATLGPPAAELLADLERALDEVDAVLASLRGGALLERRTIQGRDLVVLDAVFHVVEHFSYHLGQIVMAAKASAPDAIRFYEEAGGLARPVWDVPRP